MLDTVRSQLVYAIAFHPDGKHLVGGGDGGIRRWRLSDGQELGKQTGARLRAICLSRDHKWAVCGTYNGASVWDEEIHDKVIDVEGKSRVWAVDVSPDSTRFSTGTDKLEVSIWSIPKGERLVGPLQHDNDVTGVRFSPNGEQIATACYRGSGVRVFDSHNGDELVNIRTTAPELTAVTPLAWSSDGRRIVATSDYSKITSFDVSTGSQLAELQIINENYSLALAPNGKFIATFGGHSVEFLDASTLSRIVTVAEDNEEIRSIAISADNSCLATGQADGKIIVRNLSKILLDSYGPFHVGICAIIVPTCWVHIDTLVGVYSQSTTRRATFSVGRPQF